MSLTTENNDIGPKAKKRARYDDDDNNTLSSETEREGGKEDSLSDLPDCVLIHLMTFMKAVDSVRTSVLSTRWKHLWKRVPSLVLHSRDFHLRNTSFSKFMRHVVSHRDSPVPLHNLDLRYTVRVPERLLKRVVEYAVSHNIQCLKLSLVTYRDADFPSCVFSCQTLRSLDLAVSRPIVNPRCVFWRPFVPKSLNLTALTCLRLLGLALCADENKLVEPFSSCVNLKTLVINNCVMSNQQVLSISNATLVNLAIRSSTLYHEEAYKIMLSTPNLRCFIFSGFLSHQLAASNLSRLEEVKIGVTDSEASRRVILIGMLQVFANVRSLSVSSGTLKVLSLVPDLLNNESPCLDKLKSLKLHVKPPSPVPDGVVDYLIRNSPLAKVTTTYC